MTRALKRVGAVAVAVALLFTSWSVTTDRRAEALEPFTGYLMAHFTGEHPIGEQVYFTHSRDGLHWTELNNGAPVLLSTVGERGVRDPALVRSPAGDRYWIIATDLRMAGSGRSWNDAANNGSTSLVVWESTDLVTWSAPRLLDVAGGISGDAGNAWAPEAIHDPVSGDYVLYWATNSTVNGIRKQRIHYVRTRDFRTLTAPQVYIDRPGTQHIIDTQIIESPTSVGGYRYYRASKDSQITVEGSNSVLGSWTTIGNLSHLGLTPREVEGPMWTRFNDRAEWALWLDNAGGGGYLPLTSTNLGSTQNFQRHSDYSLGTARKRHGSILNLTAAEESRVLARWPNTPAQRLQSYNFPDRYVRHANLDVRIDPNVNPAQDAQFRLVPGLAGTGTVSFQSGNYPGYYLRHRNYDFVLAPDDGTATFKADTTFRQVAGLADTTASSFQSYNHPDRYLRHYAYQLRLDPITTTLARNDATFRVTN